MAGKDLEPSTRRPRRSWLRVFVGTGVTNGKRWVGHNGGAPGVSADFRYFPDDGITVIVLGNQSGVAMGVSGWLVDLLTKDR